MTQTAGDNLRTEDDAAVIPMVYAITGFDHGAVARHDSVEAYLFVFRFFVAGNTRMMALHL